LVAKGIGWAANTPIRAMNSVNALAQQRLTKAYEDVALLVSRAQVQLAGAPDTPEVRRLSFQLQRTYELAMNRNPGAFTMIQEMQKACGTLPQPNTIAIPKALTGKASKREVLLCPHCGKNYGKGRPFCQYCGFHASQ